MGDGVYNIQHGEQNFSINRDVFDKQINEASSWEGRTVVLKFEDKVIKMDVQQLFNQLAHQEPNTSSTQILERQAPDTKNRVRRRNVPKENQQPSKEGAVPTTEKRPAKKLPEIPKKPPVQQTTPPLKNKPEAEKFIHSFFDTDYNPSTIAKKKAGFAVEEKKNIDVIFSGLSSIKNVFEQCNKEIDEASKKEMNFKEIDEASKKEMNFKEIDEASKNIQELIKSMHEKPSLVTSENLKKLATSFQTLKSVQNAAEKLDTEIKVEVLTPARTVSTNVGNWQEIYLNNFIEKLDKNLTRINKLLE